MIRGWLDAWMVFKYCFKNSTRNTFCLKNSVSRLAMQNKYMIYINKHMIASIQVTNTEIFAFIAVLVFKLLSPKVLLINKKKIVNFTCKLLKNYKLECNIFRILLKQPSDYLSICYFNLHDCAFKIYSRTCLKIGQHLTQNIFMLPLSKIGVLDFVLSWIFRKRTKK